MKKLLTLVLALVLVFAIAAPALAITGDIVGEDPDPTKVDFVTVDIELFKSPYSDEFGFQLAPIAANQAYIVDQMLFYGVKVSMKGVDEDEETRNMAKTDYENCKLVISATGIKLNNIADKDTFAVDEDGVKVDTTNTPALTVVEKKLSQQFVGDWFKAVDWTYYAFGTGVVTAKGVIKAELKKEHDLSAADITIYDGTKPLYRVEKGTNGWDTTGCDYYVVELNATTGADKYWIGFDVVDEEVVNIYAAKDGAAPLKLIQYNIKGDLVNEVIPKALGGKDISLAANAEEAKVFAAYEKAMAFFGFNYTAEGLLQDKHFEAKASGLYLKDEVAVQLYTGSIVIPGDVVPPKTGDAASIVGFVMIAVAMIAAGVVVSKKVRA